MTGYMVTTYWQGYLNIFDMRLFNNESLAKIYLAELLQRELSSGTPSSVRFYKLSDNAEPVWVKNS